MPWFRCEGQWWGRDGVLADSPARSVWRQEEMKQLSAVRFYTPHTFYSTNCRKSAGILRPLKDHLSSSNMLTVPATLLLQFSHLLQSTKSTMCTPSLFLEVHCLWQKPGCPQSVHISAPPMYLVPTEARGGLRSRGCEQQRGSWELNPSPVEECPVSYLLSHLSRTWPTFSLNGNSPLISINSLWQ